MKTNKSIKLNISDIGTTNIITENVIIYCRVCKDVNQHALDGQEERLKSYCNEKGYNILDLPEFHGCKEFGSGKSFEERTVLLSILNYIRSNRGKVKKLIFLNWSRLTRDLYTAIKICKELLDLGIEPISIENEYDIMELSHLLHLLNESDFFDNQNVTINKRNNGYKKSSYKQHINASPLRE